MSMDLLPLQAIQEFAQAYGYWTVLLGILLENAGIPLPGETIVLAAGFLTGSGQMSYPGVLLCAITGAIIGDNLGYWLGFYGGWSLLLKLSQIFRIPEAHLQELKQRFSANAARAVFLGRFIAILRIFAGPMAGVAGMPYGQFLVYNTAGAVLWAGATVTVAAVAGQMMPLEQVVALVSQFGLLVLAAVLLWLAIPPIWKRLRAQIAAGKA